MAVRVYEVDGSPTLLWSIQPLSVLGDMTRFIMFVAPYSLYDVIAVRSLFLRVIVTHFSVSVTVCCGCCYLRAFVCYLRAFVCSSERMARGNSAVREKHLLIPLEQGWRRQTTIHGMGRRGIVGEVFYFALCGKKMKTIPDVLRVRLIGHSLSLGACLCLLPSNRICPIITGCLRPNWKILLIIIVCRYRFSRSAWLAL